VNYRSERFKETYDRLKMAWNHPSSEPCLGLRREAQRHAALEYTTASTRPGDFRPPESGVAAPALPPQSKTWWKILALSQTMAKALINLL
jgi:hypothetical protein